MMGGCLVAGLGNQDCRIIQGLIDGLALIVMEPIIAAADAGYQDKEDQHDERWVEEAPAPFFDVYGWLRGRIAIWRDQRSATIRELAAWYWQVAIASREIKSRA